MALLAILGISSEQREQHSLSSEELRTVVNESGAMLKSRDQDMLVGILDLRKRYGRRYYDPTK